MTARAVGIVYFSCDVIMGVIVASHSIFDNLQSEQSAESRANFKALKSFTPENN